MDKLCCGTGTGIGEVILVVNEDLFVLAVDGLKTRLIISSLTGVVCCYYAKDGGVDCFKEH